MTATAAQIAQLRRMTNLVGSQAYSDDDLKGYIERYPLLDALGQEPCEWDTSTSPPTREDNEDWIPTYDLSAAAADVWDEIAAGAAGDYDYCTDEANLSRSQVYQHAAGRARYYRSRRAAATRKSFKWPPEADLTNTIGRL